MKIPKGDDLFFSILSVFVFIPAFLLWVVFVKFLIACL
jgi:hypothetical protein